MDLSELAKMRKSDLIDMLIGRAAIASIETEARAYAEEFVSPEPFQRVLIAAMLKLARTFDSVNSENAGSAPALAKQLCETTTQLEQSSGVAAPAPLFSIPTG